MRIHLLRSRVNKDFWAIVIITTVLEATHCRVNTSRAYAKQIKREVSAYILERFAAQWLISPRRYIYQLLAISKWTVGVVGDEE